jgi:hypothetical protein
MNPLLYDLLLLFAGAFIGIFLDRSIRWRKARLGHETAMLATNALDDSYGIFNQAVASGGRLTHPWDRHGRAVYCDDLQNRLKTSRSRIKDKAFRKDVDSIITEIQGVWAAAHIGRASIAFSGMPKNPGDSAREEATQSKANTQLQHARNGLVIAEKARIRLERLQVHT